MTSHDVVRRVRKLAGTRKVGHAGTLDPLATGVLPVAVGQGTKILQFLFSDDKSYRATLRLGAVTDTYDSQGALIEEKPVPVFTRTEIEAACDRFRGEIEQLPPIYSALKQNGVPLYKLARQGKEIIRRPRRVVIARLEILALDQDRLTIEVDCSKGTYIRSLAHDLGAVLGCGAHLCALRRLRSGDFLLNECRSLDELQQLSDPAGALHSISTALRRYPRLELTEQAVTELKYGIPPRAVSHGDLRPGTLVCLAHADEVVAMARYAPDREKEKRADFELARVFVSY